MDRRNQPGSKIILALTAILIFAVLGFGSVEIWSSTLIEVCIITVFILWLILKDSAGEERVQGNRRDHIYMYICFIGLLVYVFIQMLPLPSNVVKYISPRSFGLYSFYGIDKETPMHISLYAYKTQIEFFRMLTYALFFVLVSYNIKDMRTLERMIIILSYFGFGLAVFALLQAATWNGKLYWFREVTGCSPFGPFVNRNHYAGFIGMLIPLTLGVAFTRKRPERQILFGFFSVIMAVSLFFSLSRAGIISFSAGIIVLGLFLSWSRFKEKRKWALAVFLLVLSLYLLNIGIDPIIDRFHKTDITREARLAVWNETFKAFQDFPITGSGLGTFVNVFQLYSPGSVMGIYDHAHNDYLEFILEAGISGAVFLICFLFFFIRYIKRGSWAGKNGIFRISMLSSITTIALHSIFDFNLHIPSNALMLSGIFGMMFATSRIGHRMSEENE